MKHTKVTKIHQTNGGQVLLVLFAAVFCFGPVGQAEPLGTAFTYQGRLIDANNAADGLYDFQFKLFDANNAGNQLGLDVNLPEVDVIDGYFTVELDFGSIFDGNERWLDIGVRPGELEDPNVYTVLTPRQEIAPAPHAIYAKTAQSVAGGVDWSGILNMPAGFADSNDDVGLLAETDPTVLESVKDGVSWGEVSGIPAGFADGVDDVGLIAETDPVFSVSAAYGITSGKIANWDTTFGWGDHSLAGYLMAETDPQVSSATTNMVPKWNGTTLVDSAVYDDSGNVGIGTTSPSQKLDVAGNAVISGNVGIGTTSPTAKLDVNGNIRTASIYETVIYSGTWTAKESDRDWWSVAMSADGTIQTAVCVGYIYVSTDSGNSWTAKESNRQWYSVAMSADGTIQTAVVQNGQIYVSTNSGNNWTAEESNRNWRSVAMSSDGSKQTAVVITGQIYVSTDSGNNWTAKESNRNWVSVAMSADGTKQTAVVWNGQIYVSTDSGDNWTTEESNRNWSSVAMSADGTQRTAVVYGGQIYVRSTGFVADLGIGTTSPKTQLNISRTLTISANSSYEAPSSGSGSNLEVRYRTDGGQDTAEIISIARGVGYKPLDIVGDPIVLTYGNVGIGTTSPSQKLDVSGNVAISGNVGIGKTSPAQRLDVTGNAAFSGNVGIGTTSPLIDLAIGDTDTGLQQRGDGQLALYTNNLERVMVDSNGNVGIGTTSPTEKLDVNGDAKVGGKQVAVGEEKLKIIRGTVLANGSVHAGSGFTVTKGATGFYQLNFTETFGARPSVVAAWKYPDSGDDFDSTGTSSNVYTICVIAVDTVKCKIKVQGTSGGAVDRAFEFMAVGPR